MLPIVVSVPESCPPRTYRSLNDFDHRPTLSTYPAEHLRVGAWRGVDWLGRRLSSPLRTHLEQRVQKSLSEKPISAVPISYHSSLHPCTVDLSHLSRNRNASTTEFAYIVTSVFGVMIFTR